jgi:hypothetical protein
MAELIVLKYDADVRLEHLFERLQRSHNASWNFSFNRAQDDRPLPPIPAMEILKKKYGDKAHLAARRDQLVVSRIGSGARIYIGGRARIGFSPPAFGITYYHSDAERVQLLKDVLRVLASEAGTKILWQGDTTVAPGPAWVRREKLIPTGTGDTIRIASLAFHFRARARRERSNGATLTYRKPTSETARKFRVVPLSASVIRFQGCPVIRFR